MVNTEIREYWVNKFATNGWQKSYIENLSDDTIEMIKHVVEDFENEFTFEDIVNSALVDWSMVAMNETEMIAKKRFNANYFTFDNLHRKGHCDFIYNFENDRVEITLDFKDVDTYVIMSALGTLEYLEDELYSNGVCEKLTIING